MYRRVVVDVVVGDEEEKSMEWVEWPVGQTASVAEPTRPSLRHPARRVRDDASRDECDTRVSTPVSR